MADYKNIRLLVLDVDGTLTDGGIYYDSEGREFKKFSAKDGLALKTAIACGLQILVLTGRKSTLVERRVKELGIQFLIQNAAKKYSALAGFLEEHGLTWEQTAYIGDDWNDYKAMSSCGVKFCPADAAEDIKKISDFVSSYKGGEGAVRECVEDFLVQTGMWAYGIDKLYLREN